MLPRLRARVAHDLTIASRFCRSSTDRLSAGAADVARLKAGHAPHAARKMTLVRESRLESEYAHRKRSDSEQRDRTIDASMDDIPVDGEAD